MSVLYGALRGLVSVGHVSERSMAAAPTAVIARLDRAIQYAEAVVAGPRSSGVLDAPVKPGHDSGVCGGIPKNPAQLSHFATLFPLALSFGTTLERIAAESLTPR
ncbi:hypothetical protein [Bradyrhizobium sp. CCGB20]|uniref:hypothetical protein n=1 Tax=Bradyrhizobium sp. CCGB20 TaxID=2949633 RepID=UPI0020B2DAA1|nr:hypothetical protein [Bradyrhizobium sp. CCGB20]MCP3396181.1 hypothetical protein [Bradyrhizobium sp. CCGB20]